MDIGTDSQESTKPPKTMIWDLPTRLCHWLLAISASLGLYSGFENKFDLVEVFGISSKIEWGSVHLYCGYSVLGLCLFRLIWGVIGSSNTRIGQAFASPRVVVNYAKTLLQPAKRTGGHNPMGGYASLILIVGFLAQAGMGLYAMDDYFYGGPLADTIDGGDSAAITSLHKAWGVFLIAFVCVHISIIAFYRLVRKRDLLTAMITGRDTLSEGEKAPKLAPLWRAVGAAALTTAALIYWIG